MNLQDLLADVATSSVVPPLEIQGLRLDSREARKGDLFAAVPGTQLDGGRFALQAVERGAVAVLAARPIPELAVPVIVVEDVRGALGHVADRFHGSPSSDVAVTGITGTNGKTTTSFLLHWILETSGRAASLLGTVSNRVGSSTQAADRTTPHAFALHQALADTRREGARDLVMEVSSHGLDQRRTAGVRFRCAVFTNLTRDHLDYHGSLEAYGAAKARLFEELEPDASAVLNARDPFATRLAQRTRARVVAYEWSARALPSFVEVGAHVIEQRLDGARLHLRLGKVSAPVELPLIGAFNIENALAAAAAAHALGVDVGAIRAGLESSQGVPGRLERISRPGQPTVLVDYAHTPDALERVLACLRPLVPGRLLVVFGAGGDRDRGKRPQMGRAVARYADQSYLTSDNPRSEDPSAILAEVLEGIPSLERVTAIEDREQAIREAVASATLDDLVLVAGKGHETGQILADRTIPFDDRAVARRALLARAA